MENKCPHCGKPMPKSSNFCMHCMRGLDERDAPCVSGKSGKKSSLILCAVLLIIALGGSAAFASAHRNKSKQVTTLSQALTTSATTQTASQNTTAAPSTTKKQKAQKQTSTTAPSTQAQVVTQAPPPTTTQAPTTASNQVVISDGVLTDYPNTKQDSFYTIPYSVKSIANGAFHGNTYLRTLKFSKRTNVACNWSSLFASLPNLETIYIYTGSSADTQGMQYFDGEIIYYYD